LIEEGKKMLARIRNDVALHEDSLAKKLAGDGISDDSLNRIEYRIAGSLSGLEDSILKTMPEVIGRATSHSEYSKPTRRGILTLFAKGVAAAMVLGVANVVNSAAYGQEAKAEITAEEIAEQMQKGTVEEILKGARVEYVQRVGNDTNFDALVYQKSLKSEDRKPVLVFFYRNTDPPNWPTPGSAHRTAIIFNKLSKKYSDKIKFVCFNQSVEPQGDAGVRAKYEIAAPPSIAMYSKFDVVLGETPFKNNGEIKRIDISRGGPAKDSGIHVTHSNLVNYWINPNLLSIPNPDKDGKIYRYNNSPKLAVAGVVLAKQ
jgi:hypothetical protein